MTYSEKELENWLWEDPSAYNASSTFCWIGRQVVVASGIIDLVGMERWSVGDGPLNYRLHVVEVKVAKHSSRFVAQVCRYAADLKWSLLSGVKFSTKKVVIGRGPYDASVQFAADAMGVHLFCCDDDMHVSGPYHWTTKQKRAHGEMNRLAKAKLETSLAAYIAERDEIDDEYRRLTGGSNS